MELDEKIELNVPGTLIMHACACCCLPRPLGGPPEAPEADKQNPLLGFGYCPKLSNL